MGKYVTADGVTVEATRTDDQTQDDGQVIEGIWTIEYPDGTVKEAHPRTFDADYLPVPTED